MTWMSSMTMMTRVSRMTTMTGKMQLYESLNLMIGYFKKIDGENYQRKCQKENRI